jgi:hypothetical protein
MIRPILVRRPRALALTVVVAALTLLPSAGGSVFAAGTGSGSVFVNKHVCPAGFPADASELKFARYCQGDSHAHGDGNGFLFVLVTDRASFQQKTGQLSPHAVTWDGVPAQVRTSIVETIPSGFGTPVVFCQGNNGSSNFERMVLHTGNTIRLNLVAGGLAYCDWYNIRR